MSLQQQANSTNRFVDSIRKAMPDVAPVREAVSFVHLVMLHPSPPHELRTLHKSQWSVADLDDIEFPEAATRLRGSAQRALQHCNRTPSGQVLEMALTAMEGSRYQAYDVGREFFLTWPRTTRQFIRGIA